MFLESEPPPFEVRNPEGSSPILIACDHAEIRIPKQLGNLGLNNDQLQMHIACDIGAKQVAIQLSRLFDAPLILSNYSRLVIDLNRHLDDPTLIADESDHIPVPGNQNLQDTDRQQRINQIFHPYHNQYSDLVTRMIEKHRTPIILSVHSFTPCMDGFSRPWHFGVLYEKDEALARRLLAAFAKLPNRVTGDNKPYDARIPQGYAQLVHARDRGVEMALIEIRQDLIACTRDQVDIANLVYEVTKSAISEHLNQLQYGC